MQKRPPSREARRALAAGSSLRRLACLADFRAGFALERQHLGCLALGGFEALLREARALLFGDVEQFLRALLSERGGGAGGFWCSDDSLLEGCRGIAPDALGRAHDALGA